MISLAGFALASALCGLAWSLNSLIAFRVIQAIPGQIATRCDIDDGVSDRPPPEDRHGNGDVRPGHRVRSRHRPDTRWLPSSNRELASGLLHQCPRGSSGTARSRSRAAEVHSRADPAIRCLGFYYRGRWAWFTLLLAFSEGASWGWSSYRVLILMVGGLLSLALFVTIELEVDHPLLNLEAFAALPTRHL